MDRLEESVGRKLLQRTPAGIVPTFYGEMLYPHARVIRDEINLAQVHLTNEGETQSSVIHLGVLPSLACNIVPLALSQWRERYPYRELQVIESVQIDLLIGLLRRDYDLAIGKTVYYDVLDGLRQRVLFRDRLCVIAKPNHPLFEEPNLTWTVLAGFPWVTPMVKGQRTVLENILRSAGVEQPLQMTACGSVSVLKSLVEESNHLTLLPEHAVYSELTQRRLSRLPITHPELERSIAVFFRDGYELDLPSRDLVACVEEIGQVVCSKLDTRT